MDRTLYLQKLDWIFHRFPSVQKSGFAKDAYKPGLEHIQAFDGLLGHPQARLRTIHVAGTNGKGSVANMLAAAISALGYRVGLYTSPHILDFRERMRIIDDCGARLISEEEVMSFLETYEDDFTTLDLSFFEITTGLAFKWFADQEVDYAVIEVGLGGRLDSTNIITPLISVVTSIGLDHCDLLGDTRAKIAAEKAGIFKHGVPALVSTRDDETAPVFERVAAQVGAPLYFADEMDARGEAWREETLAAMDLQGDCQRENLRTVCAALKILRPEASERDWNAMRCAIERTAEIADFHGRWEMLSRNPLIICDIAHNPPALKGNFGKLDRMLAAGECDDLIIVYGVMADKDLGSILPLMPRRAEYILVEPRSARSMKIDELYRRMAEYRERSLSCETTSAVIEAPNGGRGSGGYVPRRIDKQRAPFAARSVANGVKLALERAATLSAQGRKPLIYIGGSTFVVAEAVELF
jgi:dihydrofolate synthase / folylpolyglutamate synthase